MKQNATTPNSPSESSLDGYQITPNIKMAARLYRDHISELKIRKGMYEDERMLKLEELPGEALLASILQFTDDHDFYLSALDMEEVIRILLRTIAVKDLEPGIRARYADYIEQLMKVAKMFRFFEQHVVPYTQL